jgi:outer membrane protein assembly factor BamB/serine/threonine protein kinase
MMDAGRVGQQLGNYRLIRLLGRGGFAEVYLGEHIHLGTQAAIKVLYTKLDRESIDAFRAEARTIASLEHQSIVRVLDFGVEGNTPYLVMSYAPGGTLRTRYPRGTRLPLSTVVSYVQDIASALQYAHDRRLVHRDIKPENLLVGHNNEVLLSDFGIALVAQSTRFERTQDVAGTVTYMAPEQIQSHPRPASDQYSLGIVVYEWLSGEVPFQGSFTDIAVKHALMPPPSLREKVPALSPQIEQVVFTALAKDPKQRFPTVQAFAVALKQACEDTQQLTHPMSDAALYPSWQSTYIKPPSSPSWQSTALNTLPAAAPVATPVTPLPTPVTPIPTPTTFPPTPLPTSLPPVDISTAAPGAFSPAISTGKRRTPTSFRHSTRFRVILAAVACVVIISGFASFFVLSANSQHNTITSSDTLVVDHSLLDFGKIEKGAQATLAIGLSNTGKQLLRYTADAGKATWLQVQTRSATIAPGKTAMENVTIDTAHLPLGISSAPLTISSNSGNKQVQVRVQVITGQKAARLTVSTTSLDFGTVVAGASITPQPVLISNVGILALNWKASVGKAAWITLDRSSGTIAEGGSPQTINVNVQPAGLAQGSYTATLAITSNGGKQNVQVRMVVNSSSSSSTSSTSTSSSSSSSPTSSSSSPTSSSSSPTSSSSSPTVITSTVTPLWVASTGNNIYSTAAVANGIVYAGSVDHNLYAWDASSGNLIWKFTTGNEIYSSPTVYNGVVYVGSDDYKLYALDASTGTLLWSFTTGGQVRSSPVVVNGVIYFGAVYDKLYALNASTHAVIWTFTSPAAKSSYSTPVVVNGMVYVGSGDGNLYALNASTGSINWSFSTGNIVHSPPAVVNNIAYFGSENGTFYALNASSGTELWSFTTGGAIESWPVVSNNVVYFGSSDGNLYALDATSGSQLWKVTTGNAIHSSPALYNGVIYIGSNDYKVYAVNASSGAILWTYTTGLYVGASPTVANGVVYIGSGDDKMYAFTAS